MIQGTPVLGVPALNSHTLPHEPSESQIDSKDPLYERIRVPLYLSDGPFLTAHRSRYAHSVPTENGIRQSPAFDLDAFFGDCREAQVQPVGGWCCDGVHTQRANV